MKYLWFGVSLSEQDRQNIIKNGGQLFSAEVSNNTLLFGLEENGVFCDTINTYNLPSYPNYPLKKIEGYAWNRTERTNDYSVGYLNRKYISILSKTKAIKKAAQGWAKLNKNEEVVVFIYSMHSPFMSGASCIKKIIPKAKIALIVPDLPQYMDLKMSKVKAFLKKMDWLKIKYMMKKIDKYILYSKYMAEYLKLDNDKWMVMEGAIDLRMIVDEPIERDKEKHSIMYSGVLDLKYGIPELLDAMKVLKGDYELWLAGAGNAVSLIQERAKEDDRIKYLGFYSSRKELLLKQKQATMLINPRAADEEIFKYSFPSKLFEYIASGNPVISTNIAGIPEEYDKYLIKISDNTAKSIASAVEQIASMSEEDRYAFGEKAKYFVMNEKSAKAQTSNILNFLNADRE